MIPPDGIAHIQLIVRGVAAVTRSPSDAPDGRSRAYARNLGELPRPLHRFDLVF